MDGGSLAGTAFIILLILKLIGTTHMSWVWVTAPLWIDAGLTIVLMAILAAFGLSVFALVRRFL